jgi:hypothetical protein
MLSFEEACQIWRSAAIKREIASLRELKDSDTFITEITSKLQFLYLLHNSFARVVPKKQARNALVDSDDQKRIYDDMVANKIQFNGKTFGSSDLASELSNVFWDVSGIHSLYKENKVPIPTWYQEKYPVPKICAMVISCNGRNAIKKVSKYLENREIEAPFVSKEFMMEFNS